MNLAGEPNNAGGASYDDIRERCIDRKAEQGICLNDEHCEYEKPSICEIGNEDASYIAAP